MPEPVGNLPGTMLGILISAESSFFRTLKTKMSAWWSSLLGTLDLSPSRQRCPAHWLAALTVLFHKHSSLATASSSNTGVYITYKKEPGLIWSVKIVVADDEKVWQVVKKFYFLAPFKKQAMPSLFQIQSAAIYTVNLTNGASLKRLLTRQYSPCNIV